MKFKLTIQTLLAAALLTAGCNGRIYTRKDPGYPLPGRAGGITLDTSYHLYTRIIYRFKTAYTGEQGLAASGVNVPAGLLEKNKKAGTDSLNFLTGTRVKGGIPIEVEYLFLSRAHATAIYISGVADRFRERYNRPDFSARTPNADDFRVFEIGRLHSHDDSITYYNPDGKQTDNWSLHITDHDSSLFVNQIESKRFSDFENVYLLREALAHNIPFEFQKDWRIIYRSKGYAGAADTLDRQTNIVVGMPRKKKFTLGFSFPTCTLVYSDKFVIYDPIFKNR